MNKNIIKKYGNMNCTFCNINDFIFKDKYSGAFLDNKPLFKGHILLMPLTHYNNIFDTPYETIKKLYGNAKILSTALKKALNCDGILIINNNVISQSVNHYHIHIIPRNKNDHLRGFMWPREKYIDDDEKNGYKNRIINAIEELHEDHI